jgi:type I restriction enzyme S subunit
MSEATTTFGELIKSGVLSITDGYRAKNSELGGDGLIFLRAGHVTDAHIDFAGVERFHEKLTAKLQDKTSRVGDVIVTTKGNSTGRTSFVDVTMPIFVYSPHLSRWRVEDRSQIEPGFLRYWSRSPQFVNQMRGLAASTDMAPYLSLRDQHRLEITLPHIDTQRAVGAVLSALDDKIEQNRRTGRALERLARATFKAWFVDFEPVKAKAAGQTSFPGMLPTTFAALPGRFVDSELGPVPQDWEANIARVDALERKEWLLIGDGYRAKRTELSDVGVPFIRAGNVDGTVRTEGAELLGMAAVEKSGVKRSKTWDTVFTSKGTVGRIGLVTPATGEVVYAPQVCFWRSCKHDELSPYLLHLWMKSEWFTNQWMSVKGQTDMADFVSLSDQRAMTMLVPSPELQRPIEAIVRPLIELQAMLAAESAKLAALRDYLLPRLLSGRVRVKDVDLKVAHDNA